MQQLQVVSPTGPAPVVAPDGASLEAHPGLPFRRAVSGERHEQALSRFRSRRPLSTDRLGMGACETHDLHRSLATGSQVGVHS